MYVGFQYCPVERILHTVVCVDIAQDDMGLNYTALRSLYSFIVLQ